VHEAELSQSNSIHFVVQSFKMYTSRQQRNLTNLQQLQSGDCGEVNLEKKTRLMQRRERRGVSVVIGSDVPPRPAIHRRRRPHILLYRTHVGGNERKYMSDIQPRISVDEKSPAIPLLRNMLRTPSDSKYTNADELFQQKYATSNVTAVTEVRSASARLFSDTWRPLVSVITTLLCCDDYFSSSSVVSRVFFALCAYLKFGHHPHPLGYLCAKFRFFRGIHC